MTKEEAIKRIKMILEEATANEDAVSYVTSDDADALDMAIKALDQDPKTGHWRAIYQGEEIIDYRCTECEFGSTSGKSTYRMNFCPNCGARMVELPEREDKE